MYPPDLRQGFQLDELPPLTLRHTEAMEAVQSTRTVLVTTTSTTGPSVLALLWTESKVGATMEAGCPNVVVTVEVLMQAHRGGAPRRCTFALVHWLINLMDAVEMAAVATGSTVALVAKSPVIK